MGGKIFNNKKLASILGSKRKKKADGSASGPISNKYTIKKEALKLISDLVDEGCDENVNNIYFVKGQLKLIERILLTELEEYVDAKDNVDSTLELIRKQMEEEMHRLRGQTWTTNTTLIGGPINTMPQPLPGDFYYPTTIVSEPIPDGGSGSNTQQMPSGWGGLLPRANDE